VLVDEDPSRGEKTGMAFLVLEPGIDFGTNMVVASVTVAADVAARPLCSGAP